MVVVQIFGSTAEIQKHSLLHYAKDIYSQRGEDGILERIFDILQIKSGFFIEFGAADGVWFSNCRHLAEQGWDGMFIEADKKSFSKLVQNCRIYKRKCLAVNEFVTWDEQDTRGLTIDKIIETYFPNKEIDFMSIDIDGGDYLILEKLQCKPKILCVEGGFSWHPLFKKRVPDAIALQCLQQPLEEMIRIGKAKGYEPVVFTQNTIFIRNDLYAPFADIINDTFSLWRDAWRNAYYNYPDVISYLEDIRKNNSLIRSVEGDEFLKLELD